MQQYIDLEDYGEELFALAADSPKLSRSSKKRMLKTITKTQSSRIPRFTFAFTAAAFAVFAFVFGFAQFKNAPSFLASLKIARPTAQITPTTQDIEQLQQQLKGKQDKIELLKQTGAPEADILKAVEDLDTSVKKSEDKGFRVTRKTDKDGKTYLIVKSGSDSNNREDTYKIEDEKKPEDKPEIDD